MKKILTLFVLAAVLTGCRKPDHKSGDMGGLSVSLDEISDQYVTKSGDVLDANEFIYSIVSKTTGEMFLTGKVGEMPSVIEDVPADDYVITVSSPDTKPAAFDQPIISGSKDFTVKPSQITSVQVLCTIQNVKVSIVPDENFFKELTSYTVTISNGEGPENTLIWSNGVLEGSNSALLTRENVGNAKSGYFAVASALDIYITGYRSASGVEAVYEGQIRPIAAKDHFIVRLFARETGQVGGESKPGISITIDYTTQDKNEDVTVDGFIEAPVEGPDDPSAGGGEEVTPELDGLSLEWAANPEFDVYELKSSYYPAADKDTPGEVDLIVNAKNLISGFVVKIASPTEEFFKEVQAIPGAEVNGEYLVLDLLSEDTATAMGGFLPTGDKLKNQERVVFSLSELLPLIIAFGPEVDSVHTFIMEVTDMENQVLTQELKFQYKGN